MIHIVGKPLQYPRMTVEGFSDDEILLQVGPGEVALAVDQLPVGNYRITADGLSLEPAEWPLIAVRDAALRRVNEKRDAVQTGGCVTAKGVMQSDSESRLLLSGAIQMAQIALSQGQPFSMGWTMVDNTTVEHDAMELIAAGVAMGQHIARAHFTAIALKASINAAEAVNDIEAIDIEGAGWGSLP